MKRVKLKEVLRQYRNTHLIGNKDYKQVTISQTGEVSYRGTKHGSKIGRKRQFIIDLKNHPNTLIFIRQGVYKGGIGICPPEVDGCVVTENMPMFDIINIEPNYLLNYLKSPQFISDVDKLVPLGTAQKAIHEKQLLEVEIPLPLPEEQKKISKKINNFSVNKKELDSINTQNKDYIQKLRQQILQEAVQGKLVPQDPKDEPASELLKKIKAEKEKLIREGKIKKQKPLPPISEEEITYELPKGWEWVRLGDICFQITDGTHYTPRYVTEGIPFLSVKDVAHNKINLSNCKHISKEEHSELTKRCKPEFMDILLTKVGTTGIAIIVDTKQEFSIFVSVALLKYPQKLIYPYYLENLINSPLVKIQSKEGTEGVGNKNLVLRKIVNFIVPLPPLSEQKRIVEKVDNLMAYCDELEKQFKENQENAKKLMEAVLRESFESDN